MPGAREVADDHDLFRREARDDHSHAASEIVRHALQRSIRERVALLGELEQIAKREALAAAHRFTIVSQGSAVRSEHFPAAAASASADGSAGVERYVTELAGHAVQAACKLSVHENSGADTFGHRDHHEVSAVSEPIEPHGCEHARVRCVFEFDFETGLLHDRGTEIEIAPLQIGSKHQASFVNAAGHADADALQLFRSGGADKAAYALDQDFDGTFGIGGSWRRFMRREPAVRVTDGDHGLRRADVDANDDAVYIDAQERGTAAARQTACRAFDNPSLFDEFLDDQ